MTRHFGLSSGTAAGGNSQPSRSPRANTPREYINHYFPSGSILAEPASASLERLDISDSARDVIALGFAFLFLSSVGIGFAFAMFCLLFVQT